ncbi:taxane 10-beta-hydroxylase-like [Cryptomeria japonica]|uniref:taxane 10-beta-hydroxylase-like n=1 Tax=Cryptomeria japonica TaxID=3369 RepID=UPI0027DA6131|nr:taxane 10-beta-hydroxylase-like [Cryptomeria japonica]
MEYSVESIPLVLTVCSSFLAFIIFFLIEKTLQLRGQKNLPPGNLGLPLIGQTIEFLRAHKSNTGKDWIKEKVKKYGPVFKTSLMGCPTVVLTGQEGNRFVFESDESTITNKQRISVSRIIRKKNILELTGEDHKRMRGAIMQFLKSEALQKLIACDPKERQILGTDFSEAIKGVWSFPLDLPGTTFRSGLNARSRICKRLSSLLQVRREELQKGKSSPDKDLMSTMLTMTEENVKI